MTGRAVYLWAAVLLASGFLRAESQAETVSGYALDRYQTFLVRSPFAKEVVAEEEAPVAPLLGKDLILTGHYKLGDTLYAVVLNKKTQERLTLSSEETRPGHPRVVSLIVDADPTKTAALIQQGGERATLGFDQIKAPKEAMKPAKGQQAQPSPSPSISPKPTPVDSSVPSAGRSPFPRMRHKPDSN